MSAAVGTGGNRLPILAAEIAQAHAACGRATLEAIKHAVEAGHRLRDAKQLVPHGEWVPWLRANLPAISVRTAQRFMTVATRAGKSDTVSFFRLRDLARPIRERFARLDERRALILTPSTHPGFTFVTVCDLDTGEAHGFTRPVRDDAIRDVVGVMTDAPWPTSWASERSIEHSTNPWLVGALHVPCEAELVH